MDQIWSFDILIGITFGIVIILIILAVILEKFFPENRISKMLENLGEWIQYNIMEKVYS